jgi:hypothetical protein
MKDKSPTPAQVQGSNGPELSGATAKRKRSSSSYIQPPEEDSGSNDSQEEFSYTPTGNSPTGYLERGICREDILLGEGYLERGCATLLAGPSGIGKSSIQMQKGCCWSCGKAAFDLEPPRQLRIVMVQNEDSNNDLARQSEVVNSLGLDLELVRKNFWIETVRGKIGRDAIRIMAFLIKWWQADVLLINPLSAYHDGDISQNTDNMKFLYGELGGLLSQLRVGVDAAHHKGKPPKGQQKPREDVYHEIMYDILGGSVLTNFFRGIMTVSPIANCDIYRFTAAKRFEESQWLTKNQMFKWHEDRAKRLWIPASVAESDEAQKACAGKTLEALYKLTPVIGAVPKPTFQMEVMRTGFTRNQFDGLLAQALDDATPEAQRLYQWSIPNPRGAAKVAISRYPQPPDETHEAVREAKAREREAQAQERKEAKARQREEARRQKTAAAYNG